MERSDIEILHKEVRIAAIKAAKDKAAYLLAAIGEEAGKPLEIHENENTPYFSSLLANTILSTDEKVSESNSEPTNFQKFTVKFSYYIKYAIKQKLNYKLRNVLKLIDSQEYKECT